ncbi:MULTISPECIES: GNAT family N-acetyltransferase [unclassified Streptomyces]|uniref:GNAT family N-acetyltransferase n=1 Tax=unclassified Streptomyces TaxID=2593676 RepID=UPI000DC7DD5A|nr:MULTISPECIES: GNAT family N-acetyltransferase [unclassified Streptomyces]AWZ10072.1 GNAT family N-acetyltransferase [Streptomyces sp. ICC4]AWZ17727.1 GNAT family N-acetyltransferase [Streptomyces sp. ICC1]
MTTTFPDVTISTDRLVLRPFEEEDVTALTEMMNDEHITAWTAVPHPYTSADAVEWATRAAHEERTGGRGIVFAVTEFLTHRLVGIVHLQGTDWRLRATEVGYVTAPWARGEGYASESVRAVARWLFREQGFERLELRTAADNTASQQVAQKVGCISEGVLRSACIVRVQNPDGSWSDGRSDLIVWGLVPEDLDDEGDEYADGYADGYSGEYASGYSTDYSADYSIEHSTGYGGSGIRASDANGYAVSSDRN